MSESFNFYDFLKNATNQSLVFLENNDAYDDVLYALANMFDTLYTRVQDIKVTNSMDLVNSSDFQKYLNTNDGTVVIDFILEYAAQYLDTDHFKDTVALLIRQYEERRVGGEIPNLDQFIQNEIIPSFKFFTMNAGDLHKSKGVQGLIERIFEFYSPTANYEKMFDGVVEWDNEDLFDKRLEKFTSYRIGLSADNLLNNYSDNTLLEGITIKKYLEFETHKIALGDDYVFISRKDREDWWIVDNADDVFKINDDYFALYIDNTLMFYQDDIEIYSSSYEYITPTPESTYENVKFIPTVINVNDPYNHYQTNNLYFVERLESNDTFGDYEYNLIRFHHDVDRARIEFNVVKQGMGLSYDPLSYSSRTTYPKITEYISLDYIWIDLYESDDVDYAFNAEDTKLVYSYVIEYQTKQPNEFCGFTYPKSKLLVVARDGYNYDSETNGFYYNIINELDDENIDKYIFQERVITSLLQDELNKSISSETFDVKTVFDMFVPTREYIYEDDYYTFKGYWNVNSAAAPATNPEHGDYWLVSVQGEYNIAGLKDWNVDDIIVWNGNFEYWEKNNEILNLSSEKKTYYKIDRTLIALGTPEFDYVDATDNSIVSPYEKSGGMFLIKLTSIDLDVSQYSDILSSDNNAIETFGTNPFVIFTYTSSKDSHIKLIAIPMDQFTNKVYRADLNRILRKYPYINSSIVYQDLEFSDKHIIVYGYDSKNTDLGTFAIIMENTGYNLPLGLRSNNMNVQYDIDLRNLTRANQPYYRTEDDDGEEIDDEEVSAFQETLKRYTPISAESEYLAAKMDLGYTDQKIEDESVPENIEVYFSDTGATKTLKEQSNIKMQESLLLRVDGTEDDVNCDCNRQRDTLYVYDFDAMSIFYDIINLVVDPNIINPLTKVEVTKIGQTNDIYSHYQDVCRWQSEWENYFYDDGKTIPMQVRAKIRVNLYDLYQGFIPWGSSTYLKYCWGIHFYVQFLSLDSEETIPWQVAIDEEVYKPIEEYDECNPIGQFYTTALIDDGNTFPQIIADDGSTIPNYINSPYQEPWDVYDIPAAKISLT